MRRSRCAIDGPADSFVTDFPTAELLTARLRGRTTGMPMDETTSANENDLRLITERHGAAAVVRVNGELDAYRAPDLEELGASLLADGVYTLVLNMSGTTFLDSSGLRAMVTVRDRMLHAEGEFALVDPTEAVRRLLAITGLDEQFVIESSDDAHEHHDVNRSTS